MEYPRLVSLRITEEQHTHCVARGGVTRHIRRLLDADVGIGTTELEKMVAVYMKKYAPEKSV